jgi:hypothetical protein
LGNRVLVDIRESGDRGIEVRLWSKGPDDREGTEDDISGNGFGPPVQSARRPQGSLKR